MKVFRKLIRDKIPEIMARNGQKAVTRVLTNEEYIPALENKLLEEVQELRSGEADLSTKEQVEAGKKDEIADVYEVLESLIRAYGFSKEEISEIQAKKREARGGFEKKLFLERAE